MLGTNRELIFGNGLFWHHPVCKVRDKALSCFNNKSEIVLKLQVANIIK